MVNLTNSDLERFWSFVHRAGPDDCWPWLGSLVGRGRYGKFWLSGANWRAHRVAYLIENGSLDPKLKVCHTCDHGRCCNPAHLFQGTDADNSADMVKKGRQCRGQQSMPKRRPDLFIRRGEASNKALLTDELVAELRRLHGEEGLSFTELADQHNLHRTTIMRAIRGVTWNHV